MATICRIERVLSIKDIKPNPHNARFHSIKQIGQIADSIRAFGFGA
jgi:ParB-like chromosome segregation protein Spo0J